MSGFFNLLAAGARSLSFEKRCTVRDFEYKAYEPKITLVKPRTPAEIMRSAWEDVGNRMREAIGEVEEKHEQQIS
jgi:hypothetical protein